MSHDVVVVIELIHPPSSTFSLDEVSERQPSFVCVDNWLPLVATTYLLNSRYASSIRASELLDEQTVGENLPTACLVLCAFAGGEAE